MAQNESKSRGENRKHPDGETPRKRGGGIWFVFIALACVVLLALFSDGSPVIENRYQAAQYLEAGRLEPGTWVFDKERKIFRARIANPAAGKNVPRRVAVQFSSDEEVSDFRKHIEAFNQRNGTNPQDWVVEDTFFSKTVVQPLLWGVIALLVILFVFRLVRRMGPGGGMAQFGKSRARIVSEESTVTLDDVAGIEEAKEDIAEIIAFLKNPQKFQRLGGRMPRGVMLVGSPGTGKTLLARAIAGEAGVPFFSVCGSDFVEMFVGVGASRVRDLFKRARESSPCIVFLDEIDAVGRRRGTGVGGGHDEREQTLNAILVEMDGFETDEGVIILAASNRPDVLDPALLRPGRFDREVRIDLPDVKGREAILAVHAAKVQIASGVSLSGVAKTTVGFSGAELAALVNEAAIAAATKDREAVTEEDLEEARDKIRWGRSKRSRVIDESDRRITAYHEAGHAIVASISDDVDPLHKVTIVPRGPSLGVTMQLPTKENVNSTRQLLTGTLTLLYAGRVAEEMFCDCATTGAHNDILRATELARRMVCEFGMSDNLGPINYSDEEETLFLGREVSRTRSHSEDTSRRIDEEIQRLVEKAYDNARALLKKHRQGVERIAQALLEKETLSGDEVSALVASA